MAASRSMSVMRAWRIRYSTPWSRPRAAKRPCAGTRPTADRVGGPAPGRELGPGRRATRALEQRSRTRLTRGDAHGDLASPSSAPIIRHRFAATRRGVLVPRPRSVATAAPSHGSATQGRPGRRRPSVDRAHRRGELEEAHEVRACGRGARPPRSSSSVPAVAVGPGARTLKIGIYVPAVRQLPGERRPGPRRRAAGHQGGQRRRHRQGLHARGAILDHAVNGQYDAQQGAKDMTTLVSDSGRHRASSARSTRPSQGPDPDLNEAGLLQCSPGEHEPRPDQGRRRQAASRQEPGQDQLRPRRHHGRHPGPGGRAVRVPGPRPQERRDHR